MRCRLRSGATPANHAIINSIRATIMDKRPQQARIETEQRQRAIVRSRRRHEERFAHREKLQDYRLKIEIALRLRNRPKRCSTGGRREAAASDVANDLPFAVSRRLRGLADVEHASQAVQKTPFRP